MLAVLPVRRATRDEETGGNRLPRTLGGPFVHVKARDSHTIRKLGNSLLEADAAMKMPGNTPEALRGPAISGSAQLRRSRRPEQVIGDGMAQLSTDRPP